MSTEMNSAIHQGTYKIHLIFVLAILLQHCTDNRSADINSQISPVHLKVEYIENPLGIDMETPHFSWEIPNLQRGKYQSAYQIIVSTEREDLDKEQGTVWDTGKTKSDQNLNIRFEGTALQSSTRYFWKVRYWDQDDNVSEYSDRAYFETGLLRQNDWKALWIGDGRPVPEKDEDFYEKRPNPLFRKDFSIERPIKKARLYITGLGYFEAFINGQKTGNDVLHPGWTQYAKRVLYSTYDVTESLQKGANTLGVMLGNGWYNPLPLGLFKKFNLRKYLTIGRPKLIAQLHITFDNGEEMTILSDETWRWGEGPILKNDVYLGEYYDARMEQPGWQSPGFDDAAWAPAVLETPPGGVLRAQLTPPNRITKTLPPISVTEPQKGIYVFDLGQNFAGWIRLKLKGTAGETVKLKYGELLHENGRVNGMTTVAGHIKEIWNLSGGPGAPKTAFQEDTYVLKGGEEEIYQQHFTFHGFRYVEVTGFPGIPTKESLEGLRINSDLPDAGDFECSNDLLNRIQEVVEWTFLSNVFSVESDCPAREKFGYGGDIVTAGEAYMYNYDMANFYKKTVRDFEADVRPNGGLPETAPYNGIDTEGFGEGTGPIGWQLAHPFILEKLYRFYGDRDFIKAQYQTVVNLVEFLKAQATNNLIYHGISDHVSIDPKPEALTSGAFYYHIVSLLVEFAEILEKPEDVAKYGLLKEEIRKSFISEYYKAGSGAFGDDPSQITQVFGLYYGLLPENEASMAMDVLLDEILDSHQGHLSTGIFGTKMLFDVLRMYNQNEVAYTVVSQEDYPGYGYMLQNGATTLWEHWDESRNQNSKNHPMFGSVSEWYYRALGGINPAADAVGFDKVNIRPLPVQDLEFVNTSYQSARGAITSNWRKIDKGIEMEIEIPGNTTALIYLPAENPDGVVVQESGSKIYERGASIDTEHLMFVEKGDDHVVFKSGGGKYRFTIVEE